MVIVHQHRRPEILHEQENDQTSQQSAHDDVVAQVADRIFEQLRLVPGNGELYVRILVPEMLHQAVDLGPQIAHLRVRLLDDGHRNRIMRIGTHHALPPLRMLDDRRQIFELVQPVMDIQVHVLNILFGKNVRFEPDVVLVFPLPDGQISQFDVVALQGVFERLLADSERLELFAVGDDQQFGVGESADVHHGHLRDLLDPFGDHLPGETAQFHEFRRNGKQLARRCDDAVVVLVG